MNKNELIQQIEHFSGEKKYGEIITSLVGYGYALTPEIDEKLEQIFSQIDDDRAIAELCQKMKSNPSSRGGVFAAGALASINKPKVIPHVIDALVTGWGFSTSINGVRLNKLVSMIIKSIGVPAVEPLFQELEKPPRGIRLRGFVLNILNEIAAQVILNEMATQECTAILVKYLESMRRDISETAASILRKLDWQPKNDRQRILYLIATHSSDELIVIGDPAVDELIRVLRNFKESHTPSVSLIKTIGAIGNPGPVDLLIEMLSINYVTGSKIRDEVVRALGQIGNPRAIRPILDHFKNAKFLSRAKKKTCADALMSIASQHRDEVKMALADDHKRIKKVAKLVLKAFDKTPSS